MFLNVFFWPRFVSSHFFGQYFEPQIYILYFTTTIVNCYMKPFTIVFAAFWNLNQCTFNYTDSCASRKFCVMCICDLWLSNAKRAPNKWDFYDARSIFAISSHFSRFRVLLRFVSLCLTIHYKSKSTRSTGPELFELTGEQGKEWEPIDPLDVITDQKDLEPKSGKNWEPTCHLICLSKIKIKQKWYCKHFC